MSKIAACLCCLLGLLSSSCGPLQAPLPVRLDDAQVDDLFRRAAAHAGYRLHVDLEKNTLSDDYGLVLSFEVEPFRRHCLLNGVDELGFLLDQESAIADYESTHPARVSTR